MNELIKFIEEHPHCPTLYCTTCGGLQGFNLDLEKWIKSYPIDLSNLIRHTNPDDVKQVEYWYIFFDEVMKRVPEDERYFTVYPDWFNHLYEDFQYDFFALRYAPLSFFKKPENEMWINVMIRAAERKNMDREIQELINFLGEEMPKFRSLVSYQKHKEWEYQWWREKARKEEEKREEERLRIQTIVDNLSELDEKTRFIKIVEDESINLSWLPKNWSIVSDIVFEQMDSIELTRLIRHLKRKTNKSGKNVWRKLKNYLYLKRQEKYNQEKGFL